MEFVVWGSVPIGNACLLEDVENVDRSSRLNRGISLAKEFPSDAVMRMTQRHKKNTALLDDVASFSMMKVCSPRLVEFLRGFNLKNVEFLPVTVLDHKDRVASKDYCIVHPIVLQDALDVEASEASYNAITPEEIDCVEQTVLDMGKLDPEVRLFRLKAFIIPVFLDKAIADEIQAKGFKGGTFESPADFNC
jgi:hypothetical protein